MDNIRDYLGLSDKIDYVNYSFTRHIKPIRTVWYRDTICESPVTSTTYVSET